MKRFFAFFHHAFLSLVPSLSLALAGWGAGALTLAPAVEAAERAFDFDTVRAQARSLAARPYAPPASSVPARLRELTYDEHRFIQFNEARSWWRDSGGRFQLQFFHPGFLFTHTIGLHEVERGRAQPIPFDPAFFRYGSGLDVGPIPRDMGFSGFKVLTPLNRADRWDELVVFQGASYFRALGRGQYYGLSARGLAVDTLGPQGEEFPAFERFWIEKPARGAQEVTIYALLDGPSVTGAYRWVMRPGESTVMRVTVEIHRRAGAENKVIGLAPLTSMFWYGENSETRQGDFRPEVHDSDGLLMARGAGEWLWRPLVNPATPQVSSFADENPRGFGLSQRDRTFSHYEDLEAHYHLRPSAWVAPVGDWGRGEVRLVELPTPDETHDNIVAFWVPERWPERGEPLALEYDLTWYLESAPGAVQPPGGRALGSRLGRSRTHEPTWQRFVVDFGGGDLAKLAEDAPVEAVVTVGEGAVLKSQTVQKNPYNDTWRVAFALAPAEDREDSVELRCFLRAGASALTETWSYRWNP